MKITPTSTNMNPALKENSPLRPLLNAVTGVLFAGLASLLMFQYAYAEGLTKGVIAKGNIAAAGKNVTVAPAELATAFSKDPLNQNLVNAAFVLWPEKLTEAQKSTWLSVMRKMGWRSTPALQTMINEAALRQDFSGVLILADALLRRNQLFDQSAGLMNLLEAEPSTWPGVYKRLRERAPWRTNYLQVAGSIRQEAVIDGRIRTLRQLHASGDSLTRQELAPSIAAIVNAGKVADAVQIWRKHSKAAATPLHDSDFQIAVGEGANTEFTYPFEWEFLSGPGFSAFPSEDGLSGANVAIQWDGRGVPVFMRQQTSATPGHYRLSFRVDGDAQKFASKVGVRFRCGSEVIRLRNAVKLNTQFVIAETIEPVSCEFPWIDIYGEIQDRGAAVELSFNRVTLVKVST